MSTKTILLVEDSEIVREMTKAALEGAGYRVRWASGNNDLDRKIQMDENFLINLDLMVLDMELYEEMERTRDDDKGSHLGCQMTGSQIGVTLPLAHPHLKEVPFLIYSSLNPDELKSHLDELSMFAELDEQISKNYRGFVSKQPGSEIDLLQEIEKIFD